MNGRAGLDEVGHALQDLAGTVRQVAEGGSRVVPLRRRYHDWKAFGSHVFFAETGAAGQQHQRYLETHAAEFIHPHALYNPHAFYNLCTIFLPT